MRVVPSLSFPPQFAAREQQILSSLQLLHNTLITIVELRENINNLCQEAVELLPESKVNKIQCQRRVNKYGKCKSVPEIILAGNWLEQAGFQINKPIRIITLQGLLLVCPEEPAVETAPIRNMRKSV